MPKQSVVRRQARAVGECDIWKNQKHDDAVKGLQNTPASYILMRLIELWVECRRVIDFATDTLHVPLMSRSKGSESERATYGVT